MTALWSAKQEEIRQNNLQVKDFLNDIDAFVKQEVDKIKQLNINIGDKNDIKNQNHNTQKNISKTTFDKKSSMDNKANNQTKLDKTNKCPNCVEGYLQARVGQYGKFWSCHNYKECKTSFKDFKGSPKLVKGVK